MVCAIAKEFGVSKSTVHKDLTERLPEINPELANKVKEILEYHKSIRHLRRWGEGSRHQIQATASESGREETGNHHHDLREGKRSRDSSIPSAIKEIHIRKGITESEGLKRRGRRFFS